jgi:hypothetical protein
MGARGPLEHKGHMVQWSPAPLLQECGAGKLGQWNQRVVDFSPIGHGFFILLDQRVRYLHQIHYAGRHFEITTFDIFRPISQNQICRLRVIPVQETLCTNGLTDSQSDSLIQWA